MADNTLDQTVARLQNMHSFDIFALKDDGSVSPWYRVTGEIVRDLVIDETNLAHQVQTIAAQIMHWGRLAAQAKRIWEVEERGYRVWRDKKVLALLIPPKDAKDWKKPTESLIEASYRADPDYGPVNDRVERAEEAYNAAMAVLDGFRAKRDVLVRYVRRHHDESSPSLTI